MIRNIIKGKNNGGITNTTVINFFCFHFFSLFLTSIDLNIYLPVFFFFCFNSNETKAERTYEI